MNKMDKIKIIFLAIGAPFIIGGFILSLISTTFPKEEIKLIEKDKFEYVLNQYGCDVTEVPNDNKSIDNYYTTVENTCPYSINYIVFNDDNYRNTVYNNFVNDVNDNPNTTGNSKISINIMNMFYYERTTNGNYYKSVKLNKNTILYISTLKENRDNAIEMQKDLGHYYEPDWEGLKILIIPFTAALILSIIMIIITIKEKK